MISEKNSVSDTKSWPAGDYIYSNCVGWRNLLCKGAWFTWFEARFAKRNSSIFSYVVLLAYGSVFREYNSYLSL